LLVACSGPVSPTVPARAFAAQARPDLVYVLERCFRHSTTCPKAGGFVQTLGGATITSGIQNPVSIAVNPATGELYVGNNLTKAFGSVTIYAPGRVRPHSTIPHIKGDPHAISIYRTGDAYVASQYVFQCCQLRSRVASYAAGSSRPVHELRDLGALAGAPAYDASGRLYVQNFAVFPGWIAVYAPGESTPSRLVRDGIGFPEGLAVMPDGTLFVLNRKFDHTSDVLTYAPGGGKVTRRIATGFDRPLAIALDAAGNLYVANFGRRKHSGNVCVYLAGTSSVARVIRTGVDRPVDLAIDRSGHLLVLNAPAHGVNTVTVYANGGSSPLQTFALAQSATTLAL
jgi:DNA-binding beta-propeller fold protein YncE